MLWRVSAHLTKALANEEARDGFLSKEVERLASERVEELASTPSSPGSTPGAGGGPQGLDRLLEQALGGVREQGYSSLRVNGSVLCAVCVFPKDKAPTPPTEDQALVLTCSRDDLHAELYPDSPDIIEGVADLAHPRRSFRDVARRLAAPLRILEVVAQHLVYWKKMRVVELFHDSTRIDVRRGADVSPASSLADRFRRWQRDNPVAGRQPVPHIERIGDDGDLELSEVVAAFAGGQQLREAEQKLQASAPQADFDALLEWLVAEGLLVQLATYYHFLPGRAKTDPDWVRSQRVCDRLLQEFCPAALTDFEVRLLVSRAPDPQQHRFLCRFAAEFARAHCRADGHRLAAFVRAVDRDSALSLTQVEKILAANDDILVPYVCGC